MIRSRFLMSGLGLAIVLGVAACSEPTALAVDEVQPEFYFGGGQTAGSDSGNPLICPTRTTRSATGIIRQNGGTVTHHHADGRDQRPWYDRQRPPLFAEALRAAKKALDPQGLLNPGVLIDP